MESKVLNFKKGARVFDFVMFAIIGFFVFTVLFMFTSVKSDQANIPLDARYQSEFDDMNNQMGKLKTDLDDFKNKASEMQEAGLLASAYYGLSGAITVMKMPITVIYPTVLSAYNIGTRFTAGIIPSEFLIFLEIGIITIMIFGAIAFITNRAREP